MDVGCTCSIYRELGFILLHTLIKLLRFKCCSAEVCQVLGTYALHLCRHVCIVHMYKPSPWHEFCVIVLQGYFLCTYATCDIDICFTQIV